MKIFAVGMNFRSSESHASELANGRVATEVCETNYAEHNKELHNSLLKTEEPVIFTKADSALLTNGRPFFIPDFTERCDYETELVVRICRLGRSISQRFAHRYYDAVTVGIDFTARDLQERLRQQQLPWDLCKGFDGSAALGRFVKKDELLATVGAETVQDLHFRLDIDGQTVQRGHTADMIHSIDRIVSFCSRYFTLKMGDLIYTGTPCGVGPVSEGQTLTGYIGDLNLLNLRVK